MMTMTSAPEMSEVEAAELVDRLLRSGIPLTLLADLISPFGPESQQNYYLGQGQEPTSDEGEFSQSPKR